jgi:hypothetical protein
LRCFWRSASILSFAMAAADRTDRFRPVFEPEEIFDRFVKNANSGEIHAPRDDEPTGVVESGEAARVPGPRERRAPGRTPRGGPPTWDHAVTVRANPDAPEADDDGTRPDAPMPLAMARAFVVGDDDDAAGDDGAAGGEDDATVVKKGAGLTDSGQRVLLLTHVKRGAKTEPPPRPEPGAPIREPAPWESVVAPRGQHTQKLEALRLVPDVAATVRREAPALREGGEDGQMPTRELDSILSDMAVLLRYGHAGQVRDRLEQLRRTYPEDLLLLRRIAEFHVEHADKEAALETLFALAGGLFERRNVLGMRQALEQVLVLDAENARAFRLLGLLEQRPPGA